MHAFRVWVKVDVLVQKGRENVMQLTVTPLHACSSSSCLESDLFIDSAQTSLQKASDIAADYLPMIILVRHALLALEAMRL